MHLEISKALGELGGHEAVARVEHQVKISDKLWIRKYKVRATRPGGLDLYFRIFDGPAMQASDHWEILGETKWATSWGEMYDTVWDLLKLLAVSHTNQVDGELKDPKRCVAVMACVSRDDVWEDPAPNRLLTAKSKQKQIDDPWVARKLFNTSTGDSKSGVKPRKQSLGELISDRSDLWQLRVTGHDDVRSLPTSYPSTVSIQCFADESLDPDGGNDFPFRLRVITVETVDDSAKWLKTPNIDQFPKARK